MFPAVFISGSHDFFVQLLIDILIRSADACILVIAWLG